MQNHEIEIGNIYNTRSGNVYVVNAITKQQVQLTNIRNRKAVCVSAIQNVAKNFVLIGTPIRTK